MAKKLFDNDSSSPISPLIDVVMNGLGAMFIILMIYLVIMSGNDNVPEPLKFLAEVGPPPAISGQNYVFTFPVTGGMGQRRFTLHGERPKDLAFDENSGTIYGIPAVTQSRQFPLQVEVADKRSRDTRVATLILHPRAMPYDPDKTPLKISREAETLPSGRVGVAYEAVLGATGGVEPYTWRIVQGTLPAGLLLPPDGRLVGTPQQAGAFRIEVEVSHTRGTFAYQGQRYAWSAASQRRVYHFEIAESLQHALHLPVGRVGEPYLGLVLTNGRLPGERVSWTGEVAGLRPSAYDGALRGTPSTVGVFPVSYQVSAGATQLGTGAGELRILPKRPEPRVLPAVFYARVGESVRVAIPYQGMIEPVSITALQPLPKELLMVDGWLVGTHEHSDVTSVPVKIEDALGNASTGEVTLHIRPPRVPLQLDLPDTVDAVVGQVVHVQPSLTGGEGDYGWELDGQLPPNLALSPSGAVMGVLSTPGSWHLQITVHDRATGDTAARRLTLRGRYADDTQPRVVTHELPPAVPGLAYPQAFAAEGGVGPYTWLSQGKLPPGLQVTTQGIDGTVDPLAQGIWPLKITVQDAIERRATKDILLRIDPGWPALRLEKSALPPAIVGVPYHTRFVAQSCWGDCTWTVSGLPEGLTVTKGTIEGEPRRADTYPLTVSAKDSRGRQASDTYSLQILEAPAPSRQSEATTRFIGALMALMALTLVGGGGLGGFWLGKRVGQRDPFSRRGDDNTSRR
jgi:hypothetical protein